MKDDLSPYKSILANVARHISLTDDEQKFFCSLLKKRRIRKRQYVLQEGDVARFETFVDKGCLRTYYVDDNGIEHIIQFAIEDWWIGDLVSFNTDLPSKFNIDALEDSELFQIDKPSVDLLFERVPKFERFYRIIFQNSLASYQKRVLSHLAESAEERYVELRSQCTPSLEKRIPQKYIASFLGLTPESLSRLKKKLSKKK